MTYTLLAVVGVVVAVAVDELARTRLLRTRRFWVSYAIVLFFQLVVNGVLTGVPIVLYRRSAILGWRLAYAPVEDVMFGFSMIVVTLVAWSRLTRVRASDAPERRRASR